MAIKSMITPEGKRTVFFGGRSDRELEARLLLWDLWQVPLAEREEVFRCALAQIRDWVIVNEWGDTTISPGCSPRFIRKVQRSIRASCQFQSTKFVACTHAVRAIRALKNGTGDQPSFAEFQLWEAHTLLMDVQHG